MIRILLIWDNYDPDSVTSSRIHLSWNECEGLEDSLIKVGTDVRRVQNPGRAKFLQKT